jgi:Rrf2 family iron-sulfur cluster assembly transcriptional regulator
MKLTRSVSYAVGILLRVHAHKEEGAMTAAQIAKGCKFPPRFLYRVLRRLVDAGIITGVSGPGGGYALARPATAITLLQVVTAVEGTQRGNDLTPVHPKQKSAIRRINALCKQNEQQFHQSLKRVTLATLARP